MCCSVITGCCKCVVVSSLGVVNVLSRVITGCCECVVVSSLGVVTVL